MKKRESKALAKEIVSDVPVGDYAEALIDAFVESDMLKEIPIVSTVFGMSKAYRKFKDARFKQKIKEFCESAGTYSDAEMKEFSLMLEKEGKKDELVVELIEFVEKVDSEQKAKILGGVFRRLVKKEITLAQFHDQIRITNTMMLMDIFHFMHGYHNDYLLQDGLGDILLVFRMSKREISLASRSKSMVSSEMVQYIKTSFVLTGVGECYLESLHQVYRDKIQPEHLFVRNGK